MRLANAGIQRLEFQEAVTPKTSRDFLEEVLARLTLSMIDTTEARQMRRSSIRFGSVGLKGETDAPHAEPCRPPPSASRWAKRRRRCAGCIRKCATAARCRSGGRSDRAVLSVAMHGGSQVMLPLLQLKEFDQYTTTHSMNVAV